MAAFISIVIPTYNRRDQVLRAIKSALVWQHRSLRCEIIVVDDASTDGTIKRVGATYATETDAGFIKVVALADNVGAVGAKNRGVEVATGEWLVFLDSDDSLIAEACEAVIDTLYRRQDVPVVFFRCMSRLTGQLIGAAQQTEISITARRYLNFWIWGECLPAVKRTAHIAQPYIDSLRGYEGIAYARQIKLFGPASLSPIVARVYDTSGADRLSTPRKRLARGLEMARGHSILLKEFYRDLSFLKVIILCGRVVGYLVLGVLYRCWGPK